MEDVYTSEGALRDEMLLDTSWIERDVRRWCQAKGREALQSGSAAIDVFRKRASVSAFRIMALCYYLYSLESQDYNQIQRRCRKIYHFMADYILSMLLKRWGKTFEDLQARRVDLTADTGRPKLIDRLPREFSRDQLRALIQEQQVATPDRVLVSQWKANHWIEETDKFNYKKLI